MSLPRTVRLLLFAAVGLQLTVSANLLYLLGIDYAHPGGNPLGKFHPATYLLALAMFLAWRTRPIGGANPRPPRELRFFLGAMFAVMVWSTLFVGPSGVAVYVESYAVAGLFAVMVHRLDAATRLTLARLTAALVAFNVVLALGETIAHAHLVPIYLEETPLQDAPGEFRPSALYDHPLTGSAVTMMALLTLPDLRLRPWLTGAATCLLALGLVSFGERTALGIGLAFLAARIGGIEFGALLHRRVGPLHLLRVAAGAGAVAIALAVVVSATSIGERLGAHAGVDGSASARIDEWRILGLLDLHGWMFGTPIADFPRLIYKIGLTYPLTGIESFWLFALLDLGLIGFAIWGTALFAFLRHLWRNGSTAGRMATIALLLAASTSNSLGRKCNILFVLVACMAPGAAAKRSPI